MARGSSGQDPRFFKRGILLSGNDGQTGADAGLGHRVVRALSQENARPWGQSMFAQSQVTQRAKDAEKAAKAKKAKAAKAKKAKR